MSDPSKASFGLCGPCSSSDGLRLGEGSGLLTELYYVSAARPGWDCENREGEEGA